MKAEKMKAFMQNIPKKCKMVDKPLWMQSVSWEILSKLQPEIAGFELTLFLSGFMENRWIGTSFGIPKFLNFLGMPSLFSRAVCEQCFGTPNLVIIEAQVNISLLHHLPWPVEFPCFYATGTVSR